VDGITSVVPNNDDDDHDDSGRLRRLLISYYRSAVYLYIPDMPRRRKYIDTTPYRR
jgi:hypothetical protein